MQKVNTKDEHLKILRHLHFDNPGWYKSSKSIVTFDVGGIEIKMSHKHGLVLLRMLFWDGDKEEGYIWDETILPDIDYRTAVTSLLDKHGLLPITKTRKEFNSYFEE